LSCTVAAGEFLDPSSGIDEFLLARKEWVTGRTDTNPKITTRAPSIVNGSAGTVNGGLLVVGMNFCFHEVKNGYAD